MYAGGGSSARAGLAPLLWPVWLAAALAGCASAPSSPRPGAEADRPATSPEAATVRDGPPAHPPADLAQVPDAEPRVEPIRIGGPNKPYDVLGQSYVPLTWDARFAESGLASWYGRKFHGRRTASGEVYNMYAMTAAHPTLPIPSYARVRNPANGRAVVVRINDRGPFHSARILDLSYTAALKLDLLGGVSAVELTRITADDIRTGAWRDATAPAPDPTAPEAQVSHAALPGEEPVPRATPAVLQPVDSTTRPTGLTTRMADRPGRDAVTPAASTNSTTAPPTSRDEATEAESDSVRPAEPSTTASSPATGPVADAPSARAFTSPARGFWVQLGAFRQRQGAEGFHQRVEAQLDWLAPLLAVFADSALFRLQAGPYPSRDAARLAAERIRDGLRLVPVIVERR